MLILKLAFVILCVSIIAASAAGSHERKQSHEHSGSHESHENVKITVDTKYNQALSYVFMWLQHFDTITAARYTTVVYNAFDFGKKDELSSAVRILLGLSDGDVFRASTTFQEKMSDYLVVQPEITSTLRMLFSGQLSTEHATGLLTERCDKPEHRVNKLNTLYFPLGLLLNVHASQLENGQTVIFKQFQDRMADDEDTLLVLQSYAFVWQSHNGQAVDFAGAEFYGKVSGAKTFHPKFTSDTQRIQSRDMQCKDIMVIHRPVQQNERITSSKEQQVQAKSSKQFKVHFPPQKH